MNIERKYYFFFLFYFGKVEYFLVIFVIFIFKGKGKVRRIVFAVGGDG